MHHRKLFFWLTTVGVIFLVTTGIFFLLPAQPASAQCGSQASSCKNCHETQGQGPVNNDLTTWHGQHAFGDFCYLCHGGNNQATDKTAAHVGMVDPMKDIVAACKSCHPKDYEARAQIYATTLGIKGDSMVATLVVTVNPQVAAAVAPAAVAAAVPAVVVPAAEMVNYSQRYDDVVLGKKPVNVGNVILILMIAGLLLGGGFFVLNREHLVKVSFMDTKQIAGSYPVDVVDMVPDLVKLKGSARTDLRKILAKPATAAELFALVRKISGGDEESNPPVQERPEG